MNTIDKIRCQDRIDELRNIQERIQEISDDSYSDMEGADSDEFRISIQLYSGLRITAKNIGRTIASVERILKDA